MTAHADAAALLTAENARLAADNERLRAALGHYAETEHWALVVVRPYTPATHNLFVGRGDEGWEVARAALGEDPT